MSDIPQENNKAPNPTGIGGYGEHPEGINRDGRPSLYTDEVAIEICARLAEGQSLKKICKSEEMPSLRTVMYWLRDNDDFNERYLIAKQESADAIADEMIDIADETNELIHHGAEKKSNAIAQAQRLKVDTRKWIISKIKPKKYGEKVDVTSDGKAIKGNTIVFKDFSDDSES